MEIVLQHPSAGAEQGVICRLLCTSRNLQTEVHDLCAHSLVIQCKPITIQTMLQFAAWVASHSHLVGSLSWAMPPEPRTVLLEAQAALAHALQQAAKGAPSSRFQLHHYHSSCPSGAVLNSLPPQHLTSLGFTFHPDYDSIPVTIDALARLTSLREISIHGRDVGPLLAAPLQVLSRLTKLKLDMVRNVQDLQQLPNGAQLKQLQLTGVTPRWQTQQQFHLGHLTSLVDMHLRAPNWQYLALPEQPLTVQSGDILPPNLTRLVLVDCPVAGPLLQLQQLQSLCMDSSTMPAGQLILVRRALCNLTQLNLGYCMPSSADMAAAAWSSGLPVASLSLVGCSLASFSVQQLAQLSSSLTALQLWDCKPVGCTAQQFAAVLQQLMQLEELTLSWVQLLEAEDSAAACCGSRADGWLCDSDSSCTMIICRTKRDHMCTDDHSVTTSSSSQELLARAIARLPRLRRLCIEQLLRPVTDESRAADLDELQTLDFRLAAVQQLTAAIQLTHLTLAGCGLADESAGLLASSLKRLQELVLVDNPGITDIGAAIIRKLLPQLKVLSLHGTGVAVDVVH